MTATPFVSDPDRARNAAWAALTACAVRACAGCVLCDAARAVLDRG